MTTASWLKIIEGEVTTWPQVSVHSHRFGGKEFRFGKAEIGHFHNHGDVDIPFPRALRDELLRRRIVKEHQWAPNSGWATLSLESKNDVSCAIWLMRLSYLRYALKVAKAPHKSLQEECQHLRLDATFANLLSKFLPPTL